MFCFANKWLLDVELCTEVEYGEWVDGELYMFGLNEGEEENGEIEGIWEEKDGWKIGFCEGEVEDGKRVG